MLFLLAVAVRWPLLSQSLWYDEMTTLSSYVLQPWRHILAGGAGEYVPNNHVLHTILAKLIYTAGSTGEAATPPHERLLRMPALLAGSLVPIALAWPLRRREPWFAFGLSIVAAFHPWLVAMSVEARGYSLMLLLGIVATHALPDGRKRLSVVYAVTLALAAYTVPLAVLLIPAHGFTVLVLPRVRHSNLDPSQSSSTDTTAESRDSAFRSWIFSAGLAVVLIGALYLPMLGGLRAYYRHPYPNTIGYKALVDAVPRFALAGERLPRRLNPYFHAPDAPADAAYWALPVLVIMIGSVLAWTRTGVRPLLLSMGAATAVAMAVPLVSRGATEVRFVPWILPWFCVSFIALLLAADRVYAMIAAGMCLLTLIAFQLHADLTMLPNQPIREGIRQADQIAPAGRGIILLYTGSKPAAQLYRTEAPRHLLVPVTDLAEFQSAERDLRQTTGFSPWVVIFYEQLARERNTGPPETRGIWTELIRNYHLAAPRIAGRIAPVAVYCPNREPRVPVAALKVFDPNVR